MVRWLRRLFWLMVIAGGLTAIWIVADGLNNTDEFADVAIIFGARVRPDGSLSTALEARLKHALFLHRNARVSQIIVSGGTGIEGHDEAAFMRNYLVENGVSIEEIHLDQMGNDSRLTATNAARILKNEGFHSAIVVSQYFHITRTRLACQQEGIETVYGSAPKVFHLKDLISVPREVLGLWAYAVRLK